MQADGGEGTVAPLQQDQEGLRARTLLEAYAEAKGLPIDFLRSLGLTDSEYFKTPAIRMPYVDRTATSRRSGSGSPSTATTSSDGSKRSKLCLYGLTRLRKARDLGYVVLVEGESCAQTLWFHDIPALGIPGANNWNDARDAPALDGIGTIYIVVEPDHGGQAVLDWLKSSRLTTGRDPEDRRDGPTEIVLERVTDPGGARSTSGARSPSSPRPARPSSSSRSPTRRMSPTSISRIGTRSVSVSNTPSRPRSRTRNTIGSRPRSGRRPPGRAQESSRRSRASSTSSRASSTALVSSESAALCKLIYLAVTGRLLDRFASLAIKGPSASGKSWTIERVLKFFPDEAFYPLTAMSERALAYGTEPLSHRFLVLFEAVGLESDFASLPRAESRSRKGASATRRSRRAATEPSGQGSSSAKARPG